MDATDISALLERQEPEGPRLDYKEDLPANTKAEEIAKDITAFANTGGGLIVCGVKADDSGVPVAAPGIEPTVGRESRTDWYASKLRMTTFPPVDVRYFPLPAPEHPEQVLFVVEIPRSASAPHAVATGKCQYRYYVRKAAQSISVEEHEVRDLYFRAHAVPAIALVPGFATAAGCRPIVKLCNVGQGPAIKVKGHLFLGPSLAKDESPLPGHGALVDIPVIQPGEWHGIFIPAVTYALQNAGAALWMGELQDHTGVRMQSKDLLRLQAWVEAIVGGRHWPSEFDAFTDKHWEALNVWEPLIVQQVRLLKNTRNL